MDSAVSTGRTDVVSGTSQEAAPDGLRYVCNVRAVGHANACPSPQSPRSAWLLWGGSDRARVGRPGSPPRAQYPHHRSDLGAVRAGDQRVMGMVSARLQSAQASSPPPERHAPTRLHLLALSGGSAARPRHEPRGLYARKAACRKRSRRWLQQPVAGGALASVSHPHPALSDAPVLPLSDGLQHLFHMQPDPSEQRQLAPMNGAQAHAHPVPHSLPFGRAQN